MTDYSFSDFRRFASCLFKTAVASLIGCLLCSAAVQASPTQQNVILILADDLGWSDTTLYGQTSLFETPNLERLAKRGMLFTHAYSASPLCSPTRSSILTGQTPARTGFTAPTGHTGKKILKASVNKKTGPGNKALGINSITRLNTNQSTLGKVFKSAGYATGHFGKWHLGPSPYSPLEHGFDVDIPHFNGPGPAGSFVAPWKFKDFDADPGQPNQHIEDRMAKEAVAWMNSLPRDKPFFMNYWMFSVHAPFDAKADLIAKYRQRINPQKDDQHSPTYAAMVESMDDAVGTLIDAVEAAGLSENTIFVFTSDNGGNMYNGISELNQNGEEMIATPTSNRPLRGGKATIFEGGIRVPTIVSWPGITKAGTKSDAIIQSTDFYPTLLEELGIGVPPGHPVDGTNIVSALRGKKMQRQAIFTYFPHNPGVPDWLPPSISVHSGKWKLIRLFHQGTNQQHAYRLYDLSTDIGERNDLSKSNQDTVRKLDALIEAHLNETQAVVPLPNPNFDPSKYKPERIGIQPNGLKISRKTKR